jgi:ATP-binding cassette subfamily B protein
MMPAFKAMQRKLDRLNMVLRENLIGIRVIRAFNKMGYEHRRFSEANRDLTDTSIKVNRLMAVMQPIMIVLLNFTSIAIVWFGGWRVAQNNMQIGDMMAFIQYAMQILFSFIMVSVVFIMVPRAQASAERVNGVLEMEPLINDPVKPQLFQGKFSSLEFRDVTFSYEGAESPAIEEISFTTYPGETLAIIGGTGAGKSTLINLIPRFYDPEQGQILIDGIDIKEVAQLDLRSKIGFVPQSTVLFSGTIADNIRYGKKDASQEEIYHAAEVAQALSFINDMPQGFDSPISQGGTNVSGGQKQRLSIARALVRRPEIYIFDDSFSALDFKTDALLRAALKRETKDAAVIIVAQRVSTVMDADCILVLDNGRIVGKGRHQELLKNCMVYKEIVSSQLSEEEMKK